MGIVRFLKDWTLPVAIITGTAIYLIFAYVPALDEASKFFDELKAKYFADDDAGVYVPCAFRNFLQGRLP